MTEKKHNRDTSGEIGDILDDVKSDNGNVIPIVTALLALMIMVMTAGASSLILLKIKVATNRNLRFSYIR